MRLFVAVPISENLQNEILEWSRFFSRQISGLKNRGSSIAGPSGEKIIRWVKPENLHVTLVPPWEENNWKETAEKLKLLEGTIGQFGIEFNKVEYGPHRQEPRLIWAEGKPPAEIQNLKIKIENILKREPEKRPFRLHLTLARFYPRDFVRFSIKNLDEKVYWPETVNSFVLMESRLLPEGAEYKVLSRIDS